MTDAAEVSRELADSIEPLVRMLFPAGRRMAGAWRTGGLDGAKGGSLSIALSGAKRGLWIDHATGQKGDALDLVAGALGCDIRSVLPWASMWLRTDVARGRRKPSASIPSASRARAATDGADQRDAGRLKRDLDRAAEVVRQLTPIAHSPIAMTCLECVRMIDISMIADVLERVDAIGWHPAVVFREPGHPLDGEKLGAIVGVMTDAITANSTGAISRTYLGADTRKIGKARTLGSPAGIVRLSIDDEVTTGLFVAEGLETALRTLSIGLRPCWAAGSTALMKSFPPLAGIETLNLIVDHDPNGAGLKAAREAEARWVAAGADVNLILPDDVGDLDDAIRRSATTERKLEDKAQCSTKNENLR